MPSARLHLKRCSTYIRIWQGVRLLSGEGLDCSMQIFWFNQRILPYENMLSSPLLLLLCSVWHNLQKPLVFTVNLSVQGPANGDTEKIADLLQTQLDASSSS